MKRRPLNHRFRLLFAALGIGWAALPAARPLDFRAAAQSGPDEIAVKTFPPGWRLVSFPYDMGGKTPNELFSTVPDVEIVGFSEGKLDPEFGENPLQSGRAFWLHSPGDISVSVPSASNDSSLQIPLDPGWNLIGNPFKTYLPWDENVLADGVPVTDPSSPLSPILSYASENYGPVSGLQPGWGYWVKSGRQTTLTFATAPEPDPLKPLQSHFVVARGGDASAGPHSSSHAFDSALEGDADMMMADFWMSGDADDGAKTLFAAPDDDVSILTQVYPNGDYISLHDAAYLGGLDIATAWRATTGDSTFPAAGLMTAADFLSRYGGKKNLVLNLGFPTDAPLEDKKLAVDKTIAAIRNAGLESSAIVSIPFYVPVFGDKTQALQDGYALVDHFVSVSQGVRRGLYPSLQAMEEFRNGGLDVEWEAFDLLLNFYQDAYASSLHLLKQTNDILVMAAGAETLEAVQSVLDAVAPVDGFLTSSPVQTGFILGDYGRIMKLLKGPYLQNASSGSVTVTWETNFPTPTRVDYGLSPDALTASVTDDDPRSWHEAALPNLTPGARYYYRIHSFTLDDETGSFAAPPVGDAPFAFAAYGDNRTSPARHAEVVEAMLANNPDFVVNTGDIVANGYSFAEWGDQYFTPIRPLGRKAPFFVSIGNHEANAPFYYKYISQPGNEIWFAHDYGNARFVYLDTNRIYSSFEPGSEQYQWLEAELASPEFQGATWRFVSFHHPPWSVSWPSYHNGEDARLVRERLVPLFEQYGVDVVLNGHTHAYERAEKNGVVYIVTGGGGGPLEAGCQLENPETRVCLVDYHFSHFRIDGNKLSFKARLRDQTLIDSFELVK